MKKKKKQGKKKNLSYENGHKNLNLLKEDCCDDSILHYLLLYTWKKKTTKETNKAYMIMSYNCQSKQ